MTSLFGGLFAHAGADTSSNLFSNDSRFKPKQDVAHACPKEPRSAPSAGKKRAAAEQAATSKADVKAAKKPRKTATAPPPSAADAKQKLRKQALAVEAAAKAAAGHGEGDAAQQPAEAKGRNQKKGKKQREQQQQAHSDAQAAGQGGPGSATQHDTAAPPAEAAASGATVAVRNKQAEAKKKQSTKQRQGKPKQPPPEAAEQLQAANSEGTALADGGGSGAEHANEAKGAAAKKQLKKRKGGDPEQQQEVVGDEEEKGGGADGGAAPPLTLEEREAAERAKQERTVFVGNLAATVQRKALKKLFGRYGQVESVRVRSLPVDAAAKLPRKAAAITGALQRGRASAHAYVVFKERDAAEAALAHNMEEFDGLHLRVDRAASNSKGGVEGAGVQYDPTRTLFLGNLHLDIEDEDVIRCFMDPSLPGDGTGGVEAVRVVRDPKTSQGKGIAFVLFKTREACKAGLLLDGKQLKGRALRVTRPMRDPLQAAGGKGRAQKGGNSKSWQGAVTKGRGKAAVGEGRGGRARGAAGWG